MANYKVNPNCKWLINRLGRRAKDMNNIHESDLVAMFSNATLKRMIGQGVVSPVGETSAPVIDESESAAKVEEPASESFIDEEKAEHIDHIEEPAPPLPKRGRGRPRKTEVLKQ